MPSQPPLAKTRRRPKQGGRSGSLNLRGGGGAQSRGAEAAAETDGVLQPVAVAEVEDSASSIEGNEIAGMRLRVSRLHDELLASGRLLADDGCGVHESLADRRLTAAFRVRDATVELRKAVRQRASPAEAEARAAVARGAEPGAAACAVRVAVPRFEQDVI